ncbi:MAG TPA: sensor histidine kinase [Acidimicrobiia bacterium]|nr:sensor histidine kinase [Acidimicrobiia bacterium]
MTARASGGPWWKRALVIDIVVVMVLAAVLVVLVSVASESGARQVDSLAYVVVLAQALIQLFRRSRPVPVLVMSVILVFAYHAMGYPAIGNFPLVVPLFTVAVTGHTTAAVVATAISTMGTLGWMLAGESQSFLLSFSIVVREAAVLIAVVMAGIAIRNRRLLTIESRERLRLARVERDALAASERMRIARELHDIVAHTVAVIGIQARVATDTLADDPDQARKALEVISTSTREATSELRATIDVLREGEDAPLTPAPGLSQLPALVDSVRSGGLPVELVLTGDVRKLPGSVELTAYRVVQESLTNVVRHASASRAGVGIDYLPGLLTVTVTDDGIGGEAGSGFGIRGMRERVVAAGGTLAADSTGNGGFRVRAEIPLHTDS